MSGVGQQRRFRPWAIRSGLPSTSDMTGHRLNGSEGPTADIPLQLVRIGSGSP